MPPRPVAIAVAQPTCRASDLAWNAIEHARLILTAKARLVVFPELSLTGYELNAEPVAPTASALTAPRLTSALR